MRLCLFGAAGDTSNLGVSALMISAVSEIAREQPEAEVTVFDNGWGVRNGSVRVGGVEFPIRLCGARHSRRFHRPECLWNMRVAAWTGSSWNPGTRSMARADAILDVSGGDSFSDLYGLRRFRAMTLPKRIALELRRPLILLPQTYGPFETGSTRRIAASLLQRSAMTWARCDRSFEAMKELLGDEFDPTRHRAGVDMAFGLEPSEPRTPLGEPLASWLERSGGRDVVGFNVSGLIYNDPEAGRRYGFRADYRAVVEGFVSRLLHETDAVVVFVPHVLARHGSVESDGTAARAILGGLPRHLRERVAIAPEDLAPGEAKWLISRMTWFCGTRMHSTIAGLSSGVPTAAIAYSPKTKGVFELSGQGEHVAEARDASTGEMLARLWSSWESRKRAEVRLRELLPAIRMKVREQMRTILSTIGAAATSCLERSV